MTVHFLVGQLAGLEQDVVGDADLADVVQRGGLGQQLDDLVGQEAGKTVVGLQTPGQDAHVFLGAADVVAGLRVARFGQFGQGVDGDVLDQQDVAHAPRHSASR